MGNNTPARCIALNEGNSVTPRQPDNKQCRNKPAENGYLCTRHVRLLDHWDHVQFHSHFERNRNQILALISQGNGATVKAKTNRKKPGKPSQQTSDSGLQWFLGLAVPVLVAIAGAIFALQVERSFLANLDIDTSALQHTDSYFPLISKNISLIFMSVLIIILYVLFFILICAVYTGPKKRLKIAIIRIKYRLICRILTQYGVKFVRRLSFKGYLSKGYLVGYVASIFCLALISSMHLAVVNGKAIYTCAKKQENPVQNGEWQHCIWSNAGYLARFSTTFFGVRVGQRVPASWRVPPIVTVLLESRSVFTDNHDLMKQSYGHHGTDENILIKNNVSEPMLLLGSYGKNEIFYTLGKLGHPVFIPISDIRAISYGHMRLHADDKKTEPEKPEPTAKTLAVSIKPAKELQQMHQELLAALANIKAGVPPTTLTLDIKNADAALEKLVEKLPQSFTVSHDGQVALTITDSLKLTGGVQLNPPNGKEGFKVDIKDSLRDEKGPLKQFGEAFAKPGTYKKTGTIIKPIPSVMPQRLVLNDDVELIKGTPGDTESPDLQEDLTVFGNVDKGQAIVALDNIAKAVADNKAAREALVEAVKELAVEHGDVAEAIKGLTSPGGNRTAKMPEMWLGMHTRLREECRKTKWHDSNPLEFARNAVRPEAKSDALRSWRKAVTSAAAQALNARRDKPLLVVFEGGADSTGAPDINLKISEQRASFAHKLFEKHIDAAIRGQVKGENEAAKKQDFNQMRNRLYIVSIGTGEWENYSRTDSRNHRESGGSLKPRAVYMRLCHIDNTIEGQSKTAADGIGQ